MDTLERYSETEYIEWLQNVNDRFYELCKAQNYDLEQKKITSTVIKKHDTFGIDDGIVIFAMETMDENDFDDTFEPYHVIQIVYTGDKITVNNIHSLTIADSNFNDFYSQYRFNMTKTYPASINHAAHKIFNYFIDWYNTYIRDF